MGEAHTVIAPQREILYIIHHKGAQAPVPAPLAWLSQLIPPSISPTGTLYYTHSLRTV